MFHSRDCESHRTTPQHTGRLQITRRGSGAFWLDSPLHPARRPRLQQTNAGAPGMAVQAARADPRPRTFHQLFQSLNKRPRNHQRNKKSVMRVPAQNDLRGHTSCPPSANDQGGRTADHVRRARDRGDACWRYGVNVELTRGVAKRVQMVGFVPVDGIDRGLVSVPLYRVMGFAPLKWKTCNPDVPQLRIPQLQEE
jgi:hypothetical protein